MPIKPKDFIELDYTGKLKDGEVIFDTSDKAIAEKEGIFNPKMEYAPMVICIGEGMMVRGLEDAIVSKDIGKHSIELTPENAFGKKDAKLVQLIPTKKFKEQQIQPMPGLQINIDGAMGIVRSVSGGRTLVDFNHPLSGKDIIYDINIKRIITDNAEKLKAVVKTGMGIEPNITVKDNKAEVKIEKELPPEITQTLVKKMKELTGLKDIAFVVGKKEESKKEPNASKQPSA